MSGESRTDGTDPLWIGLLGPLDVRQGPTRLSVGGPKARAVLAMLALEPGRVVSASKLIDGIWGEDAPAGAQATLQVHVSNLRKALGPGVVITRPPGYLLDPARTAFDVAEFEADLAAAATDRAADRLEAARAAVTRALGRWRGPALADLADAPFTQAAATWLDDRRVRAVEEHADLSLLVGEHRDAVADLELALRDAPHRERLWGQLMVALYRSGRQADALAAYQRARQTLGEGLGIDPGPELRRLEAAVLAQDPSLDGPSAPTTDGPSGPMPVDGATTHRAAFQVGCRFELDDGRAHTLEGLTTIGRHDDCDITLSDPAISRRHAEVRPALGGYLLIDLGSTNGTLVNDAPALHHVLEDGDLVRIGAHHLRFRSDPA